MKSPLKRAAQARRERRRQALDALDAVAHLNGEPAPVHAIAPVIEGATDDELRGYVQWLRRELAVVTEECNRREIDIDDAG